MSSHSLSDFNLITVYELQSFRDGRWIISGHFTDQPAAMEQARRLDRAGKLVRVRAETCSRSGRGLTTRTVYLSSTVKNIWHDERHKIVIPRVKPPQGCDNAVLSESNAINPYFLLVKFSMIAFAGLAVLVALHSLHEKL
jgi:hypothetical protein